MRPLSTPRTAWQVEADKGYIAEPLACTNQSCQAKNSMRIMHNRSGFADKQIIRIQEARRHPRTPLTPLTPLTRLTHPLHPSHTPNTR